MKQRQASSSASAEFKIQLQPNKQESKSLEVKIDLQNVHLEITNISPHQDQNENVQEQFQKKSEQQIEYKQQQKGVEAKPQIIDKNNTNIQNSKYKKEDILEHIPAEPINQTNKANHPKQKKIKTAPAQEVKNKVEKKATKGQQSLQKNKLIKLIFTHFCKENYISSMRSSLFEDKQKTMEEMSLNKWMVFCKEFDIFTKLCSRKIKNIKKTAQQQQVVSLQGSHFREQLKVKELKEVQRNLGLIFKKSAQNHTRMHFQHFLEAIRLLQEEFSQGNEQSLLSEVDFAKKHLFCQNQKECWKKLSNLKFTFGIPQIDYQKAIQTSIGCRNISKSSLIKEQLKQNFNQAQHGMRTKNLSDKKKMNLNHIIKQAKATLLSSENASPITSIRKHVSKINLTIGSQKKERKKLEKKKVENELLKFFDSTQDEILQSYFRCEKKLGSIQK